jgi:hypothetical protein
MKFVVDSSVAFKWVVPESDTPRAIHLRDEFRATIHELIAPDDDFWMEDKGVERPTPCLQRCRRRVATEDNHGWHTPSDIM